MLSLKVIYTHSSLCFVMHVLFYSFAETAVMVSVRFGCRFFSLPFSPTGSTRQLRYLGDL